MTSTAQPKTDLKGNSSDDDEWDEEGDPDGRNNLSDGDEVDDDDEDDDDDDDEDHDSDNDNDEDDEDETTDEFSHSTSSSRTGSTISFGSLVGTPPTSYNFLAAPHTCLRKGLARRKNLLEQVLKSDDDSSGNDFDDADVDVEDEEDSAYFSDLDDLEDTAERGKLHGNQKIRFQPSYQESGSASSSASNSRDGSTGTNVECPPLSERMHSAPLIMTTEPSPTVALKAALRITNLSSSAPNTTILTLSNNTTPEPESTSFPSLVEPDDLSSSTTSQTSMSESRETIPPQPRKASDAGFLRLPVDLERQIHRASLHEKNFDFSLIPTADVQIEPKRSIGEKQRSVKQVRDLERQISKSDPSPDYSKKERASLAQSLPENSLKANDPPDGGLNRSKHMERKKAARNAKNNVQQSGGKEGGRPDAFSPINPNLRKLNSSGDANTKKFYDMVTEEAVQTKTKISKIGSVTTIDNIQLGELIGKGAFGSVYRGLNSRTGKLVAVKRMPIHVRPEAAGSLMTEMGLMESFDHPNIVKYIQFIPSRNHFNFVMEFAEGGSLSSILKNFGSFEESLILVYLSQVLIGLKYLHSRNVVHRDIKAANILLTKDGVVKLADFGISLIIEAQTQEDNQPQWGEGSPYWMAPEVIQGHRPTTSGDIWSLGCTIFELLTGSPPYGDMPAMSALFKMVHEGHPPLPNDISESLRDFLLRCFRFDPLLRPSAENLLEHPFITNDNLEQYQLDHPLQDSNNPHNEEALEASKDPSLLLDSMTNKTGSCSNLLVTRSRNISIGDDEDVIEKTWKANSGPATSPITTSRSFGASTFEPKLPIKKQTSIYSLENFWNVPIKGVLHKTIALPNHLKVTALIAVENYIWIGCSDGSIAIYNHGGEFVSRNSDSHKGAVNQFLYIGEDLNQVWSCSNDCTVKIWNSKLGTFPKPKRGWLDLDVKTITGTKKRKIWCQIYQSMFLYYRTDSGKEKDLLGTVNLTEDSVLAVDRSKKNRRYCFTLESANKRFRFYATDVEEMTEWMRAFYTAMRGNNLRHIRTLPTPENLEINCLLNVDDTVWVGGMDMTVRVWKKKSHESVQDISLEPYGLSLKKMERVVWRMLKLKYEKAIWVACGNIIIRVHSETLVPLDELCGHERLINCMIETKGGICREKGVSEVWSCGGDKTIRIWNSKTGNCERYWEGHHDKIAQLLWTGDYVWSSSWGSSIRLWKNKTGDFDQEIPTQSKSPIVCLALSEQNEEIYLGSSDSTVYVWK